MVAVARSAEAAGFSTLWSGEHIVMVDRPDSPYPYASEGRIAVPSDADWLDPFVTLSFAAAVTSRFAGHRDPLAPRAQSARRGEAGGLLGQALERAIRHGGRNRLVVGGVRGTRRAVPGSGQAHAGVRRRDAYAVELQPCHVRGRVRAVRSGSQLSQAVPRHLHSGGPGGEQSMPRWLAWLRTAMVGTASISPWTRSKSGWPCCRRSVNSTREIVRHSTSPCRPATAPHRTLCGSSGWGSTSSWWWIPRPRTPTRLRPGSRTCPAMGSWVSSWR